MECGTGRVGQSVGALLHFPRHDGAWLAALSVFRHAAPGDSARSRSIHPGVEFGCCKPRPHFELLLRRVCSSHLRCNPCGASAGVGCLQRIVARTDGSCPAAVVNLAFAAVAHAKVQAKGGPDCRQPLVCIARGGPGSMLRLSPSEQHGGVLWTRQRNSAELRDSGSPVEQCKKVFRMRRSHVAHQAQARHRGMTGFLCQ
mmetsp:Transcript_70822/g.153799  ORF Transcript_70822/g.153799 Transcript_70822/m.153799 type:complete len:200 (+) Transcript_70822:1338-1937(+)